MQLIGLRPPLPPSLAFFLGGIFRNIKVGVLIFFRTFVRSRLDVQQNLGKHIISKTKGIISLLSLFEYPTIHTYGRIVGQFENSINPLRNPTRRSQKNKKKKKKRCLSIVINSYSEEFSWKRISPGDVADRHTQEKAPTSDNKLHFPEMHKWRGLVTGEKGLRDLHLGFKDLHLGVSLGPRWVPFFFFSPFGLVLFL